MTGQDNKEAAEREARGAGSLHKIRRESMSPLLRLITGFRTNHYRSSLGETNASSTVVPPEVYELVRLVVI